MRLVIDEMPDDSIALWNSATRTLVSGDAVLTAHGKVWHTPEIVDAASAPTPANASRNYPSPTYCPATDDRFTLPRPFGRNGGAECALRYLSVR